MFTNLLYFLLALVIYTTSDLFETPQYFSPSIVLNALFISVLFYLICHMAFRRLADKTRKDPAGNMDHLINQSISKLSALALIVFAVNIYGFNLKLVFSGVKAFEAFPTIQAILFLGLFLFYLIMIWNEAFQVQKKYFAGTVSKKEFIISNVSFSLPALLPWFCLSIFSDILGLLPSQPLKNFLETPTGEISYIALFFVAIAIFGPVLIRKLWRCRPLEPGYARTRIETVCKNTNLKYADILRWELFGGSMITAGVMGLIGQFRYILVTPALLNSLDDDELDAVMLHEIGHVQKNHMLFYLFFFAGFIACNFVFFEPMIRLLYILEPVYSLFELAGIEKSNAIPIMISLMMIGFFILYFRFVFGLFMRNFERQADLHLYQYKADASPLISTFYKIASYSRQSLEKPNWHHFSIGQRIQFLKQCQLNPWLIKTHHLKVKKLISGYFLIVLVCFYTGYSINYGFAKESFDMFIAEKILIQQMDVDPENSDLYALIGDYYYQRENYTKAIDSYENVLRVDSKNVHALNNLSWLLSTCPEEEFRNAEKALKYAEKALEQKQEAFVLDTYAEALFVNNDFQNAVAASREALLQSKDKREYYKSQLRRFEKMLTN